MPITLYPESEDAWLKLRASDVTSTESAALLGFSPYTTVFELHLTKADRIHIPFAETERTRWGKRLERAIGKAVGEYQGVKVRRMSAYIRSDVYRQMGASFDYEVVGLAPDWAGEETELRRLYREQGPGVLEIKCVDYLVWRDDWAKDDDGKFEAPVHIEIQLQHQLEVVRRGWACIAVLIAGNRLELVTRQRDEAVGKRLGEEVERFWRRIDAGIVPEPDFSRDIEAIKALFPRTEVGKIVDLTGSNRVAELVAEHKHHSDVAKTAKECADAAAAEIRMLIGDAQKALVPGASVSAYDVAAGTVERKAHRVVRITHKTQKVAA